MLFHRLQDTLYKACVRSVTCYAIKRAEFSRMQTIKMRLTCGKTLRDKKANSVLKWTDVETIDTHLSGHRLRYLALLVKLSAFNLEQVNAEKLIKSDSKHNCETRKT